MLYTVVVHSKHTVLSYYQHHPHVSLFCGHLKLFINSAQLLNEEENRSD